MALFRDPDDLVELSIQALCKYVCGLIDCYINNSCSIKDTCLHLDHLLKDSVPQSLANRVTENILRALDAKLTQIDENLSRLFCVLILPTVTRLDFCRDLLHQVPHKVFYYHWNGHIIPAVLQRVHALQHLEVLRIFHTFYGKYIFPSSLIEFTYHNNCDKEILKQVSECCKGLKKLDLYNSNCIGDSSVQSILKFRFLEHIDLFGTYINEKGMTELLQKLARNISRGKASQLKTFGCSNLTSRQFEILVDGFPELTRLMFAKNTVCNFDLLANLKLLKSFSITAVSAKDLDKILETVGSQLILLHVGCDELFDLHKFAVKCIAVECLHINSVSREILVPTVKEAKKLPGMKSVKCLYANLHYCPQAVAYLIATCENIEILEVNSDSDGDVIANAILKKPVTKLRELNWWCSCDVKDVTVRVVQHCRNLEVLRGYYVWKKRGNINNDIPLDRNIDHLRIL